MKVPLVTADEGFSSLAKHMSRWMEQVLGSDYARFHRDQAWRPAIDLYEDDRSYYLVADLAGVNPEKIDLHVEKGKLLFRGERQSPRPPGQADCPAPAPGSLRLHLMEINQGPFVRAIQLPASVDGDGICACYKNGFLWVKMPKKADRT